MVQQFVRGEVLSIIVAWVVLSAAISLRFASTAFQGNLDSILAIVAVFVAVATGFIFHEMGHKFVAIRYGYVAHFRIWIWGIALTIFIAAITGGYILFGAPGAVYISPIAGGAFGYGYYSSNYKRVDQDYENMVISAAGPGLNLAFAALFFLLFYFSPYASFPWFVGEYGSLLNISLGAFNMIPFPPLDGSKIFRKSIPVGLAIALPLWASFAYILFFGF
jgi:Zn-dependent protease